MKFRLSLTAFLAVCGAMPARAQTAVTFGLATGSEPRSLQVRDTSGAWVNVGTLNNGSHVLAFDLSAMLTGLGYTPLRPSNNLSDVSNVATARGNLGAAPLASPVFTGAPAAPTASPNTNSTQIATTAYTDGAFIANGVVSVTTQTGVDPTGASDSTTGLTAILTSTAAAGKGAIFPCGTYLVDAVTVPTNARLYAAQKGCVTLKRKNSAAGSYVLTATGVHNFTIDGFILDANTTGNAATASTAIKISASSYLFSIRNNKFIGYNSTNASTFGTGVEINDCANTANGTVSEVVGNTATASTSGMLTGILVQRCQNLTIDRNSSSGHLYAGIAVTDPALPVAAAATNVNISITGNDVISNGIGIDVAGYTSGPGIGGVSIWSASSFVNDKITISGNSMSANSSYGCLIQARDLTMANNRITGNGTTTVYGGCAVNSSRFSITGNVVNENSYFGLDIGGSSYGELSGNVIRANGKTIGQAYGLNLGATINVHVGPNDVGDNGGASGGCEVIGSSVDGSGTASYFPWIGSGLTIDGLKITPTNSAMCVFKLANGWANVSIPNLTIDNTIGVAAPFQVYVDGSTLRIGNVSVFESSGVWTPSVASASSITVPDYAEVVNITGNTTINTIQSYMTSVLGSSAAGGLRELVPSNKGANYSASATITCTSTGGTPATVSPARSADGKIYGGYILTPGSGASAMSCTAADQSCTATAGAVTVASGAVTAVATNAAGTGCTNPPAVNITGLTCTNNPRVSSRVAAGAVTSYVVDYGGSGCTGSGTATVANGSGFVATAYLGAYQVDRQFRFRFASTPTVKNGIGNVYIAAGDFVAATTRSLLLFCSFGSCVGQ